MGRPSQSPALDSRPIVHTFLRKKSLLMKDEEQYEPWHNDCAREQNHNQHSRQRAGGSRRSREGQALRQQVGPLGHAPAGDHACDGDDGEQPGTPRGVANQQHQRTEPAQSAENDQRQCS